MEENITSENVIFRAFQKWNIFRVGLRSRTFINFRLEYHTVPYSLYVIMKSHEIEFIEPNGLQCAII